MKYNINQIIKEIKSKAKPKDLAAMARFGMNPNNRLGLSVVEMRKIAKKIGSDHDLALKLFDSGYVESRIIAALIDEPDKVTENQMDKWVRKFSSWDDTDQICMNLFDKTPFAWKKIKEWS